jgi:ribonuclease HII
MNVGVDEAGKGCIFGPVYAAAVIWNNSIDHPYLKDSKKMTKLQREVVYDFITENAIDYGISYAENTTIDNIGIHHANMQAMHNALDSITLDFDHIYVDGNVFKSYRTDHTCVVGGDSKYKSIMAASILAKVSHDRHINNLLRKHNDLEKYGLLTNMGYGTKIHIDAVQKYGRHSFHRHSFKLPFEKRACLID